MDMSQGAAQMAAQASPVHFAKAALRRLALEKIEPTPENYARAYAAESGEDAQAKSWAELLQRLAQGLDRGSRLWTAARKKDSLTRVLAGSRSDAQLLLQRVSHLLTAWEGESADAGVGMAAPALGLLDAALPVSVSLDAPTPAANLETPDASGWLSLLHSLAATLRAALPEGEPRAAELAASLGKLVEDIAASGATPELARQADELCQRARRQLGQRHRLLDELGNLCRELTQGMTDLAEDDSWARGQCEVLQACLAEGVNVRNVRTASDLLANARKRQGELRNERLQARDALKEMIQGMLVELSQFGEHTGRFHENVGRHAEAIARADSLGSLAGLVREMVDESRAVQSIVSQTQGRLHAEQVRAGEMQLRMRELESELRRLSDEVSTDALTQVANRRGLAQAFEAECARMRRAHADALPNGLAVGLIDIDNFKKLNDTLGHAAGDVALQKLAAQVREKLRPRDTVARFGGEEFVVLLPDEPAPQAQQTLTRLQRNLTASLFMHDNKEVFVTFSAGVTELRDGESLEHALERSDEALYEAKRTGKNRTCIG
jgi:diguanylate cyclase